MRSNPPHGGCRIGTGRFERLLGLSLGRALSAEECLKEAQDCLALAESTSDPELRDQYLKLARNLQDLAAIIIAMKSKVVDIDTAPDATLRENPSAGSEPEALAPPFRNR